jgi:glutamate mutase epsilon subunit
MHPTNCNGLTATNSQPAETYREITNDLNSATGARHSKAEASLIAILALAGHSVYQLKDGGYLVSKYGYTFHAGDFDALLAFTVRLGVCHE